MTQRTTFIPPVVAALTVAALLLGGGAAAFADSGHGKGNGHAKRFSDASSSWRADNDDGDDDNDRDDDDENGNRGEFCYKFTPPGHLIAPGWLKHNDDEDDDRDDAERERCVKFLPAGIQKKLGRNRGTTTPSDTTPPVLREVVVTNVSTTGATITWKTNELADGHMFYGKTSPLVLDNDVTAEADDPAYGLTHTITLTGLDPNTKYYIRPHAHDNEGNDGFAPESFFATLAMGGAATTTDTTAPVISGISASPVGMTTATVNWTTNEAATSRVYYGTISPVSVTTPQFSSTTLVVAHAAALTGLTAGTTYYYVVGSTDAAGNVATSAQRSFTTATSSTATSTDTTAPIVSGTAITSLTATSANLIWNTNEGAASRLFRSTTLPVATATPVYANASFLTSHNALFSGLTASTTYYFLNESTDAAGNVGIAGPFVFTTAAGTTTATTTDTTAPVIAGATASSTGSTTARVAWTTNEAATSKVYYGTTTSLNLALANFVSSASLVLSHLVNLIGLAASSTYYAVVESTDAAGNTATTTLPAFTTAGY